jgi:hypothetical protein
LLIGVLEWIGVEGKPDNPRNIQLRALRKIFKLLKKGGSVCIGIENRIGFSYLLDAKDHSGLKFTSFMPRFVADLYMKLRKPSYRSNREASDYRTYTYTPRGYQKLLKEAGFEKMEIFVAYPHYCHPRCLIEMNEPRIRLFFSKIFQPNSFRDEVFSKIFRVLSTLRTARFLAPNLIIIAEK